MKSKRMSTEVVPPPDGPSIEPTRIELSKSAAKYAKRKALRPYLILTPTLLLTLGILIPFFAAIYLSFTDFTLRSSDYSFIGFDNYGSMLQNPDFWHSLAGHSPICLHCARRWRCSWESAWRFC